MGPPQHRLLHVRPRAALVRRRNLALAIAALLAIVAVRIVLVEPLTVASDSMEPTIAEGSTVVLLKTRTADPGSLVSFRSPVDGAITLKRIVAGGGQTVAFEDALLYVDDRRVSEPFVDHSRIDGTYFGPITVPRGHVFVLGDNRGRSIDSRDFGTIPVESLRGTVIWPLP